MERQENSLYELLKDLQIDESKENQNGITNDATMIHSIVEKELQPSNMLRHYYIQKKLGSGGMGDVYKAIDTSQNKLVAIKSLKFTASENARNRFVREYKFLRAVTHENLIKAYDMFQEGTKTYMALEFVEGKSLRDLLENGEFLTLGDKIAIGSKIARGVEILNTAGIIHRDIKPANIMVNKDSGQVKILDLGLGKQVNAEQTQLTMNDQILGTVMYLSPEQTQGQVTPKSDVFSLGVVLYQLFTGMKESLRVSLFALG